MVRSWVTSLLSGGYQPRAGNGGREMGMEGDYGLSFPYSNGADKMSLKAWSTCFEGKGHLATIPFKESLTGRVCLVINVSRQWLERYTGRCHRAVAMLTLGEPSRPAYVGRLRKACTGRLRCSLLTALQLLYFTLWGSQSRDSPAAMVRKSLRENREARTMVGGFVGVKIPDTPASLRHSGFFTTLVKSNPLHRTGSQKQKYTLTGTRRWRRHSLFLTQGAWNLP